MTEWLALLVGLGFGYLIGSARRLVAEDRLQRERALDLAMICGQRDRADRALRERVRAIRGSGQK